MSGMYNDNMSQFDYTGGQPGHPGGMGGPPQGQQPQGSPPDAMGGMFGQGAPIANLGMQYGSSMVSSAAGQYLPFLAALWQSMKYYFDVNNSYVVNKLKLILFPYRQKIWYRSPGEDSGAMQPDGTSAPIKYKPPSADLMAPDLYLPSMSFLTFVLLTGLLKGTNMKFTPEVLSDVTGSCVVTQILEMLVLKGALYFLSSATSVSIFDLLALTGYKYIGLVINAVVGLLTGSLLVYYVSLVYTGVAAVFFMANTLRHVVPEEQHLAASKNRNIFLISTALLQFILMWFLGYSGDL